MKPVRTILAKTAALQLLGTGLAAIPATPARAVGGAATDWMHNAKFGVMQHWLAEGCPGSDGSCGDPAPTVSSWKYGTPDYQPNVVSVSNHEAPNWYRDAKFGIFIHWGVYAVPAYKNEWYWREQETKNSDVYNHHLATCGQNVVYDDFIAKFYSRQL